jgi:hypothetical protein
MIQSLETTAGLLLIVAAVALVVVAAPNTIDIVASAIGLVAGVILGVVTGGRSA